jgi:hypothetical protein
VLLPVVSRATATWDRPNPLRNMAGDQTDPYRVARTA